MRLPFVVRPAQHPELLVPLRVLADVDDAARCRHTQAMRPQGWANGCGREDAEENGGESTMGNILGQPWTEGQTRNPPQVTSL